ncbi:MAG: regulatory protein RecX [Phycisphaerales bacterium]|jgi:regulatory protein|nr:regulatory protein RecX [Phycisphaerales bacterium]
MTRPRPRGHEHEESRSKEIDPTADSRVTAVRAAAEHPGLVELEIDGIAVGVLPKAEIDLDQIVTGLRSDDPRVIAARRSIEIRTTRTRALDLLANRGHAAAELLEKLRKREVADEVAHAVIEELLEDGWLDDAAFARSRISDWRAAGRSDADCRRRLSEAGISDALISSELLAVEPTEPATSPEQNAAQEALTRIRRSIKGTDQASLRRIAARMSRRGFELDMIRAALRQCGLDESMLDDDFDQESNP